MNHAKHAAEFLASAIYDDFLFGRQDKSKTVTQLESRIQHAITAALAEQAASHAAMVRRLGLEWNTEADAIIESSKNCANTHIRDLDLMKAASLRVCARALTSELERALKGDLKG